MLKEISIREIINNIEKHTNNEVTVKGWIKTIRKQKDYIFINLFDGTCFENLQLIISSLNVNNFEDIAKLNTGAAIIVSGKLVPAYKGEGLELELYTLDVEGACPPDYPLQPKKHSMEFLRSIAHLRPRTNIFQAVFRVRSEAAFALHEFFHQNNFVYIHTPIITASDAEGAGEMFQVTTLNMENVPLTDEQKIDYTQDFFGKKTSLTVSGQLNAECYAQAFQNVYTFGPTFRAEQSNTARHAAEFWMLEPEIAFCDLEKDMDIAEAMLKFSIKRILERCSTEIEFFNKFIDSSLKERLNFVVNSPFARVTYTECIDILTKAKKKFEYEVFWGCDLQTEHERYLTEEHFKQPIFVINYPKEIKAFYMRQNDDQKTVAAMDCLVPGVGELIGGSQREERFEYLVKRIEELGMDVEDYKWYLDLRKFGSTKHAGFGLGFERFIMYLTGINNIRDVILFPRTTGNATF